MKTDLVSCFLNQNIEGIDKRELLKALDGKSDVFRMDGERILRHVPSGKQVVLDCAMKYFKPRQTYYRFNHNSRCSFVKKAFHVNSENCNGCIKECILQGLELKPKKVKIARDYFTK